MALSKHANLRGEMHLTGSRVLVGFCHPEPYFRRIKESIFTWLITNPKLEDTFIQSDVQAHLVQGQSPGAT